MRFETHISIQSHGGFGRSGVAGQSPFPHFWEGPRGGGGDSGDCGGMKMFEGKLGWGGGSCFTVVV